MQKINPFLWFDNQAEEAANFYTSIFKNSKILNVSRYDEESAKVSGRPAGSAMVVAFEIEGQTFTALNGGPIFKFTEAISFVVNCENQEEIDNLWGKLSAHPESEQCGWLKDKYGVSWQIIPKDMSELISNEKSMAAMLKMKKIDIQALKDASEEK